MTPDIIITAEIKCPRCDASFSHFEGVNTPVFQCGSIAQRAYMACNYAATLRARVKELEEALNQIANQDYRGNRSAESQIAYAALKKGTK